MSDELIAPSVTVLVLVFLLLWVPALHLCDGCWQKIVRSRANRLIDSVDEASQVSEPIQIA